MLICNWVTDDEGALVMQWTEQKPVEKREAGTPARSGTGASRAVGVKIYVGGTQALAAGSICMAAMAGQASTPGP